MSRCAGSRESPALLSLAAGLLCLAVSVGKMARAGDDYALGPGDGISIAVLNNPELATQQRVGQQGTIRFPFVGDIAIAGLSEGEAAAKVAQLLEQRGIAKDPQVILTVTEYRNQEVSLVGEVVKPGQYYLSGKRRTVIDMLAEAGWVTPTAAHYLILLRQEGGSRAEHRLELTDLYQSKSGKNIDVRPGDVIVAPRMEVFYVYGEVHKPGMYRLEPGITVMQAIAVAGGLTEKATQRGITVERSTGHPETQRLEATLNMTLQPNDVLYIEESLF